MPPPVRTVDLWLQAYAEDDRPRLEQLTVPDDRLYLSAALDANRDDILSGTLPTRPLSYEIDEIIEKQPQRWIVALKLRVPNPLPFSAERIGESLSGIPETRIARQRLLVVRLPGSDQWGVQLDLEQVVKRARYGEEVLKLLGDGALARAGAMLAEGVPAPPDNGISAAPDHLKEELGAYVAKARRRVSALRAKPTDSKPN